MPLQPVPAGIQLPERPKFNIDKCKLADQHTVVVYNTFDQPFTAEEEEIIEEHLSTVWSLVVKVCGDLGREGPIAAIMGRGLHKSENEPDGVPKHTTVRLFDRCNISFGTLHLPPKLGETLEPFKGTTAFFNNRWFEGLYPHKIKVKVKI